MALGMMAILKNPEIKERLSKILERLQIDTTCDAEKDKVFTYLGKDKKADHDRITIVKVEQIGHAELGKSKAPSIGYKNHHISAK